MITDPTPGHLPLASAFRKQVRKLRSSRRPQHATVILALPLSSLGAFVLRRANKEPWAGLDTEQFHEQLDENSHRPPASLGVLVQTTVTGITTVKRTRLPALGFAEEHTT